MKPEKPSFPLWWHARGGWSKRIRGRVYYFGKDEAAALAEYTRVREDREAGREPRQKAEDAATVADVANAFLTVKRDAVRTGELTPVTFGEYYRAAEHAVVTFGKARAVLDLTPGDFRQLRLVAASRLGPAALKKFITLVRTLFSFAYEEELIDRPVRYGSAFDKPENAKLRFARDARGKKLIDPADLWKMIDAADPQMTAMIFLGINCGYGQTDCSTLTRSMLTAESELIDALRRKTAERRRCPLWPETVAALAEAAKFRLIPKVPADADLLTVQGNPWVRHRDTGDGTVSRVDSVSHAFTRIARGRGLTLAGSFYILRHQFRTTADAVKDTPAVRLIMGHGDPSIDRSYRESIDDDRLVAVTDHVRNWLFDEEKA